MNDRGVLQGLDGIHMKFIGLSTNYLPLMCRVFRVEENYNMIGWNILYQAVQLKITGNETRHKIVSKSQYSVSSLFILIRLLGDGTYVFQHHSLSQISYN